MYMSAMNNLCDQNGLAGCDCGGACGQHAQQLAGLGWAQLIPAAISAFGGKSGGGGGAPGNMNSNTNTVTSNVNTQVSPQISPVFIQQDEPQNSAVNASASMVPATGSIPGIDTPLMPVSMPAMYAPPANRGLDINKEVLIVGALGAVALAIIAKKRKKAA